MLSYEQLAASIVAWAQTQADIRAVVACGSWARGDADRWSDLDLILLTTLPERYAAESSWLAQFGGLWLAYSEATGPGDPEWYALYAGGVKTDLVLLRVEDDSLGLEALLTLYPYQGVFGRGVKVLFDRLGEPRDLPPKPFTAPAPPTVAEFEHVASGFLMASITTAKFIARGDLWRAQRWFANDLHVHLLAMLEWQAHGRDTWYDGRFMETWADPRVLAALLGIFPAYDARDARQALRNLLALFRQVSEETAARFGFTYPAAVHEQIAGVIEGVLNDTT